MAVRGNMVGLRVSKVEYDALTLAADADHRTKPALVRIVLLDWLKVDRPLVHAAMATRGDGVQSLKPIGLRLNDAEYDALYRAAAACYRPMSILVRIVMLDWLVSKGFLTPLSNTSA